MKSAFARWRLGAQPAIPPALLKNLVPIVVLAIGITAMVTMYAWRDQANYKPVFGAREKVAVTDMMATLDAEHIPYRLHPDSGQVLVPDAMLGKVRMLLASKGVTAQLPAGLELMDKNDPLGVSQFVQDVRFRRGLEGELAQSIMTMDAIASARVHLSIAKSTSFVASDGDKSSASVVVALKPGRTLAQEQIAAVINMVAGSVASLAPTRVSLVDQSGNLLSSHIDLTDGFDASAAGNEGAKRFQDEIRRNVTGLLGPVIGEDNFKLSVTAAVNNDRVDETLEKYGEAPKVTSEAMREEQERNRTVAGIPGSLSNRPPAAAVPAPADAAGAAPADGAPKPSDDGTARKNATTRQYAYDRSITQIKRSRGRLEKLSVAVVLNSAAAPNPKTGWTPAELGNIEKMLSSGLGINAQRGDSLSLTALAFPAKPPVAQWWEERDTVVDFSSWLLYALGAILGYFLILRPLLRLLTTRLAPPPLKQLDPALALGGASAAGANGVAAAGAPALGVNGSPLALEGEAAAGNMPVVPLLENYDLPPPGSAVDVMVDHLKVLAEKEPERVAEVVKQWMQKNGRTQQQ
ncbi:flagellar basal-body MS-ring/collar protein FliF [Janthinobacterium lividum]|uniref:flagellar basal-body MS-ring/collar protein FliF n=1 Tax=Janthinobacterium lividum TaxID=29581 RepID=UPI00087376A4|nr:flagellar basal-body MS-ring/collar protein FliF [Janthinobacterium lividum]MBR7632533.1 flagellar M-ring protein FliF [Janthinobacterium lividum]MCC7712819.1 flagellar M-ring protein FliF [Janthinobacterium lividum]OEZ65734.1 flagellar M-ring protein [Janthinobacterium lividum]QKY08628.1 flagellar M-ring protein FliF [Janthinobacterium lividum]WQE31256.1 flagellar basal-body MS-ring/collar protein FliF [Janthinobacterium lividum]